MAAPPLYGKLLVTLSEVGTPGGSMHFFSALATVVYATST